MKNGKNLRMKERRKEEWKELKNEGIKEGMCVRRNEQKKK
jgi:hypothetical protein